MLPLSRLAAVSLAGNRADRRERIRWIAPAAEGEEAEPLQGGQAGSTTASAALTYIALAQQRYDEAIALTETPCEQGEDAADARQRFLAALQLFDEKHPAVPWTFCLATHLLIADSNFQGASMFVGLCEERCGKPACLEHIRMLRSSLPEAASEPTDRAGGP